MQWQSWWQWGSVRVPLLGQSRPPLLRMLLSNPIHEGLPWFLPCCSSGNCCALSPVPTAVYKPRVFCASPRTTQVSLFPYSTPTQPRLWPLAVASPSEPRPRGAGGALGPFLTHRPGASCRSCCWRGAVAVGINRQRALRFGWLPRLAAREQHPRPVSPRQGASGRTRGAGTAAASAGRGSEPGRQARGVREWRPWRMGRPRPQPSGRASRPPPPSGTWRIHGPAGASRALPPGTPRGPGRGGSVPALRWRPRARTRTWSWRRRSSGAGRRGTGGGSATSHSGCCRRGPRARPRRRGARRTRVSGGGGGERAGWPPVPTRQGMGRRRGRLLARCRRPGLAAPSRWAGVGGSCGCPGCRAWGRGLGSAGLRGVVCLPMPAPRPRSGREGEMPGRGGGSSGSGALGDHAALLVGVSAAERSGSTGAQVAAAPLRARPSGLQPGRPRLQRSLQLLRTCRAGSLLPPAQRCSWAGALVVPLSFSEGHCFT